MKIGFVSPYAWDIPGGVQAHIRDLALHYRNHGHEVSVLAPSVSEEVGDSDFVTIAGRPVSIPYNGAVARVLFGPVAASRVRQWIDTNKFDVLHLHEPAIPSLSLLACSIAEGPMVGTFHVAAPKQRAAFAVAPIIVPIVEKLRARIAVSEEARRTLTDHIDTDAVVIPNGIDVNFFARALPHEEWRRGSTIGFLGRYNEPRKGLDLLLAALPEILAHNPDTRIFIAGPGESMEVMQSIAPHHRNRVLFLGRISDEEKARFLKSVDVYVAPNTGGESFGIILAEAMAAGTPIIASDLPAFASVLGNGRYGELFVNGDSRSLATAINKLLANSQMRLEMGRVAEEGSRKFDWSVVGAEIMNVYLHAIGENEKVTVGSERWRRRREREL